jgi:hypothetical protein
VRRRWAIVATNLSHWRRSRRSQPADAGVLAASDHRTATFSPQLDGYVYEAISEPQWPGGFPPMRSTRRILRASQLLRETRARLPGAAYRRDLPPPSMFRSFCREAGRSHHPLLATNTALALALSAVASRGPLHIGAAVDGCRLRQMLAIFKKTVVRAPARPDAPPSRFPQMTSLPAMGGRRALPRLQRPRPRGTGRANLATRLAERENGEHRAHGIRHGTRNQQSARRTLQRWTR